MYKLLSISLSVLALAGAGRAAEPELLRVDLAPDAPLEFVARDLGDSRVENRGGAQVLDLHCTLTLRNKSQQRVRGVTLLITAQTVTPGGRGSVAVPSLDVAPGEVFPLRVDLRLLRPAGAGAGAGAMVDVAVDGVLFDDLRFYGPDKLQSTQRSLTVWELEARRDRKHFAAVLAAKGRTGLQAEAQARWRDLQARPGLDVQVARGRVTAMEAALPMQFAFAKQPEAPVALVRGEASLTASDVRMPRVEIRNTGARPVRHVEMGWLVDDGSGRTYYASSLPASVTLAPGRNATITEQTALRLSPRGQNRALDVTAMTGFVSSVEFADRQVWVPSRVELLSGKLGAAVGPSPEEQRLLEIYRKRGVDALIAELRKFQ
jgi:hypothetical protein